MLRRAAAPAFGILLALACPVAAGASDGRITPSSTDAATIGHRIEPPPLLSACPIDGEHEFIDSWGFGRSGGRRHEGVDMLAEPGTPVVAVRDGVVQFKSSRLGGKSVWLTTENGDTFFYAHLSDWHGESRTATAGEVIGYVGSSGNATGPHLHFETHPRGRVTNPYPATLVACVPPVQIDDSNDWLRDGVVFDSRHASAQLRDDLRASCPAGDG